MLGMFSYSKAAVERAMKVQEVMMRAWAKKITWWQAAEILGITDRHLRRIREAYEKFGYFSLLDKRRGQPSPKRMPVATVEKVLALYREKYFDLNVRHFHEKLREQHQIEVSYTWVKSALQGAGLVARQRQRGVHRKRRARRPLPGMLLHIDGSHHQWFQDERWYDLIVILDDATSEIYYAQLSEDESTLTVMAGLKEVIESKGVFCALYSDRGSHFWLTPKAGGKIDPHRLTQVGRAMRELGVQMIPAYSPQARGRSERNFGTWQGRLPQELRLRGIHTLEAANRFLREHYIGEFNARFQQPAAQRGSAFVRRSWTELSPLPMAPSVSGTTVRKECLWTKKKSARVRLWKRRKAEKSKTRLSRRAWKSRKHRGIPTLPQPRRRREINQNRTFHLLQKPDILIRYQHAG